MADLRCRSPLEDLVVPGVYGVAPSGGAGVTITDRRGLALCQVMARRGRSGDLAKALGIGAVPSVATQDAGVTALPLSPGQWMLIATEGRDGACARDVAARIDGTGYVSDQSHGRVVIRVSGPGTLGVLRKGCRMDLHPRVARPGFCAQTPIAGIAALLHLVDASPTVDLAVASGFAEDFWRWLTQAAAEVGYRVDIEANA